MVKNTAPHKRMCGAFGYGGFEVPKYNTFIEDKNGERIDFILDVAKRSRLNMGIRDGTLTCLLYTSPSPRDRTRSRMPSSA